MLKLDLLQNTNNTESLEANAIDIVYIDLVNFPFQILSHDLSDLVSLLFRQRVIDDLTAIRKNVVHRKFSLQQCQLFFQILCHYLQQKISHIAFQIITTECLIYIKITNLIFKLADMKIMKINNKYDEKVVGR